MSYKARTIAAPTGIINVGPIYIDPTQIQFQTLYYVCRLPNSKVRLKQPLRVTFHYKSDKTDGQWSQVTTLVTDVVNHGDGCLGIPLIVDGQEWPGVNIGWNFKLWPYGPTTELLYDES